MPLRLLCLTAHPDDETGAFGGALLIAAARGIETAVLCLTEGAAGSYREPGQSDQALAAQRRDEFARASAILRVAHAELLQYGDGTLWQEPFLPLASMLTGAIRRLRPHIVLTFGAEGGVNLHKDHSMIALAGTAAFHWAGRRGFFPEQGEPWAPQKLYYAGTPFVSTRDKQAEASAARTPTSLSYALTGEIKVRKLEAFRQHGSQGDLLEKVQAEHGDVFAEESYLLAAARQPIPGERDLWDGVAEE